MTRPSPVDLVTASPAHIGTIARRLREADRREVEARGLTPKQALRLGLVGSSWSMTVKIDGRCEALLGLTVTSALGGEGCPWLLGSDALYAHASYFLRLWPDLLSRMLDSTPHRLSNIVGSFNQPAIRLLRRFGFVVGEEVILSVGGVDFLPFSMER